MTEFDESAIVDVEERLRRAMLASDVDALDALISADLIFTDHLGRVFGKEEDLAAHRSRMLRFHALDPAELRIAMHGGLAVVSVRMAVAGSYGGAEFAAKLRFTRVWRRAPSGGWQVIAGHGSEVRP